MSNKNQDNIRVLPNKAAIKNEAADWFVRMETSQLSETDIDELREWSQRSEFHRKYLLDLAATWDAMGILTELADIFPLPEKEPDHSRPKNLLKRLWNKLGAMWQMPLILATATACLLLTFLFITQSALSTRNPSEAYFTEVGEQASHTLADGTIVTLNTNSKVIVSYDDSRRSVTLQQGEANFQVAKNPERPFVVYAGSGMVWAVGTAFNVRYTQQGVDVTVTEGTVMIFSDIKAPEVKTDLPKELTKGPVNSKSIAKIMDEAILDAGESILYDYAVQPSEPVMKEELERKLAWQQGALVFKGETLQQAIAEIGRYTEREILITDPGLTGIRVGGHYKINDIDALFTSLAEGLDINIERDGDRILLSANKAL